jgi:hypothetical protein
MQETLEIILGKNTLEVFKEKNEFEQKDKDLGTHEAPDRLHHADPLPGHVLKA